MKNTTRITASTGIALALLTALPAFANEGSANVSVRADGPKAETHAGLKIGFPNLGLMHQENKHDDPKPPSDRHATSTEDRMGKAQDRGAAMVDMRIKSLQTLLTRISGMKLLSADDLASIKASINAEIDILNDLKAKISADATVDATKDDNSQITKANRVYLLVLPKAHIVAAADRVKAVVTQMEAFSAKLSDRIEAARTAGVDVSAAVTALADYNAKAADAKVQADAAISGTVNLTPDNGDKTIQASNLKALQDARAKLKAAEADLKAAHADAQIIVNVVKGKK